MPRAPNPSTLVNAMRSVQGRESNYRQWSERATIIGFNEATQSYEIVVSAAGPSGAETNSANRTLREIKSLFPTDLRTFNPGDSVLVGYVSEKKEHPVIMGLGDNNPYTGTTPAITLPTQTASAKRVGGVGGVNPGTPGSACPMRVNDPQTGSTTTLMVDCSMLTPDRKLQLPNMPRVTCGVGEISWSTNATGVTVSGAGTNGILGELDLGPNTGVNVTGTAYKTGRYHICNGGFNAMDVKSYGCADQILIDCNKFLANSNKYDPTSCHYCGEGDVACAIGDTADTAIETNDPEFGTGSACVAARPCNAQGTMCDARTAQMILDGCNPCGLALNNKIITATDANGNTVSITITVATS